MNEQQRERLFRALVGPLEGISRGTREVLERICAEEMRRIAPVVDGIIAECVAAAKDPRGMLQTAANAETNRALDGIARDIAGPAAWAPSENVDGRLVERPNGEVARCIRG